MERYIKTFEDYFNKPVEEVEEIKVSFKEFLKLSKNEDFDISGNDITLKFKSKVDPKKFEHSEIKTIEVRDSWDNLNKSEYNFFRSKGIYSFKEFIDFVKQNYKNKISL